MKFTVQKEVLRLTINFQMIQLELDGLPNNVFMITFLILTYRSIFADIQIASTDYFQ